MQLLFKVKDKIRTTLTDAVRNGYLTLDNGGVGEIWLTSDYEFSIQNLIIGPGAVAFDILIEMNLNPDRDTSPVWGILYSATRIAGDLDAYKIVMDEFDSFKNDIRITITNNEAGSDRKFYYFVSASARSEMPNRKY